MKSIRFYSVLFILALIQPFAQGQLIDTVLFNVEYSYSYHYDHSDLTKVYIRPMVLSVCNNFSRYTSYFSYERTRPEPPVQNLIGEQAPKPKNIYLSSLKASGPLITYNALGGYYLDKIYNVPSKNCKFHFAMLGIYDYITEIKDDKISWVLLDSTKFIGGHLCQKAEGNFKGRDYTIWFASDLPYFYGPWKLSGCPGLILEAYDKEGVVSFKFNSFIYEVSTNTISQLSDKINKLDNKRFYEMVENYRQDPSTIYRAQLNTDSEFSYRYEDNLGQYFSQDQFNLEIQEKIKNSKNIITNPLEREAR